MLKYIIPTVLLLAACGEKTNPQNTQDNTEKVIKSFKNEAEMNQRMIEIDALAETNDQIAASLKYQKEDGSFVQVFGHMNRDNQILKIEEQFSDGGGKTNGTIIYYLNEGKPFVVHELLDEVVNGTANFVDRISYYDAKGKVLKTKERRSDFQETTEKMSYSPAPLHTTSMDRAMRVLNSEKEFEVTFQGFVYDGAHTYLIVGENTKKDAYTCALRCDYKDPLIIELEGNPEAFLGQKLNLKFEMATDREFEFMAYAGGKFADE